MFIVMLVETKKVPQGSSPGLNEFNIFINYLDTSVCWGGLIIRLADDLRTGRIVNTLENKIRNQSDLNKLANSSKTNKMSFKIEAAAMGCFIGSKKPPPLIQIIRKEMLSKH